MTYALHPLCETLPDMPADQFRHLVEDIRANGLRHPIILFEGKILDGRHRYRACQESGIEPRFEQFSGGDPVAFVLSENLARRHLTDGQRAMVAAKIANLGKGAPPKKSANWQISPVSQKLAGKMLNVSMRSLARATEIKHTGIPALIEKVEAGAISLNEANRIANLGPQAQEKIVAIDNKRQRQLALTESLHRSRSRQSKPPRDNVFALPQNDSPLVQSALNRLELFTHDLLGNEMTSEQFVDQFLKEIDWARPRMEMRLALCGRAMEAISLLYERLRAQGKVAA